MASSGQGILDIIIAEGAEPMFGPAGGAEPLDDWLPPCDRDVVFDLFVLILGLARDEDEWFAI